MSERDDVFSQPHHDTSSSFSFSSSSCLLTPKILLDSLRIFLRNKQIFLSIFALTTLPLSALLFSLSLSSHSLKSRIYHLEFLASLARTRFEARHVWRESREDAASIFRAKALFFLPCYALSLIAAVASVSSVTLALNGKRPTLRSAVAAVKLTWKGPLVTSILVHALLLAYVLAQRTLSAVFPSSAPRLVILIVGSGLEIYLMAALSLGLVVSIAEETFGWEAIRVGVRPDGREEGVRVGFVGHVCLVDGLYSEGAGEGDERSGSVWEAIIDGGEGGSWGRGQVGSDWVVRGSGALGLCGYHGFLLRL